MQVQIPVIPVILINGFLESGKTFFINDALTEDSFSLESRSLIIMCEEGEEELDGKLLTKNNIAVETIANKQDFNYENLAAMMRKHRPNLVIIEFNGMWNLQEVRFPSFFSIEEQVTVINSLTFNAFFSNMRQLFVDMIRNSHLVVINRCVDDKEAAVIKRTLRIVNQKAAYVLLDNNNKEMHPADDLPFSLDGDTIKVSDDAYGIWYIDTFDSHNRYEGRTVEFNAMLVYSKKLPPKCFIAGRTAITCCEADKQFIGHLCKTAITHNIKDKSWVKVKAVMHYIYSQQYKEEEAVLEVIELTPIKEIENPVLKLV